MSRDHIMTLARLLELLTQQGLTHEQAMASEIWVGAHDRHRNFHVAHVENDFPSTTLRSTYGAESEHVEPASIRLPVNFGKLAFREYKT